LLGCIENEFNINVSSFIFSVYKGTVSCALTCSTSTSKLSKLDGVVVVNSIFFPETVNFNDSQTGALK